MSYYKRIVKLMDCDCAYGKNEVGTVHCENEDGFMRCEICGEVKEQDQDKVIYL